MCPRWAGIRNPSHHRTSKRWLEAQYESRSNRQTALITAASGGIGSGVAEVLADAGVRVLCEEYRGEHVDGYGYSRFCDLYRDWLKTVSATMRQTHAAGEKLFVDWAGDTVPVFDAATGMERRAHIFVAVLGASNYTYAEGRWSEALPEWIGAHVNAFTAIGGVPGAVVCDNLKAGVTATCRYEPGINRTYQDLATHYDTAILPTRPRKPRDKAKVQVGVLIIERYVLARLRNRRFFSLFELNAAIREIVAALNARIMRKLGVSRLELLETVERSALKELPSEPYQYAEWKKCRVAPDYHVEVERHYYSVPSRLIREQVEARITDSTVEIFHIQNVNAYTSRLKDWLRPFKGVASWYLPNYLGWRRAIEQLG